MNIQGLTFIKKSKKAGGSTSPDIDFSITIEMEQRTGFVLCSIE